MQQAIVYEQPLNERVRTLLRLEFLFQQLSHASQGKDASDSRLALVTMNDILMILNRADLKTEFIKELERQMISLNALRNARGVDQDQLRKILHELEHCSDTLLALSGPIGGELRQNELLANMRQRSSIAGGTCAFDLPMLHFWLSRSTEVRQQDLHHWLQELAITESATLLILRLLRECALAGPEVAPSGFYQKSLGGSGQHQMIRVLLDPLLQVYPEISGSKHRFSIRFLQSQGMQRSLQTTADVDFRLCICSL